MKKSVLTPLQATFGLLLMGCGSRGVPAASSALPPSRSVVAQGPYELNAQEYFKRRGANVLVFSNWYNGLFGDSKMSGIELIHHGVRTATNGDVRLNITPEQWDEIPKFVKRQVNTEEGWVEAFLRYPQHDFDYSIRVVAQASGLDIQVRSDAAIPKQLEGKLGFNLEFLPSAYFEKSYFLDSRSGLFPRYPTGLKEINDQTPPTLLASGHKLVLAPGDPERRVSIAALEGTLELFDGRSKAQNGWFVVRTVLPAEKQGTLVHWHLDANTIAGWTRQPMIAHSQVGYHPAQSKVAVLELDAHSTDLSEASLVRIAADGSTRQALSLAPSPWGNYTRYHYAKFDFSRVREPGLYRIEYGGVTTAPFAIADSVYDNAWQSTLDMFLPIQMDHLLIDEAYRVWHGAGHLDDALQAPVNHDHFDLYAQGPTTDTPFAPGQHIPGLNIGGWHDAGDYDIRTQTQYGTVMDLVNVWERFGIGRDTMTVNYPARNIQLHEGDKAPDLLQQVEHGALALVAQHRAVGHAIAGIIVPSISQYTHLGDALTMTDNRVYDAKLGELVEKAGRSGKFDDRWAFTSRSSALNFGSIAGLAAASRVLKSQNADLAAECLKTALKTWKYEATHEPALFHHGNTTGGSLESEKFKAATELLLTTGDASYAVAVQELLPTIAAEQFERLATWALRALPHMNTQYRSALQQLIGKYEEHSNKLLAGNPFGVPITTGGWAGSGSVIRYGVTHYYLHKAFPAPEHRQAVYRSLDYLYGNHPGSNLSLVTNVGTRSKQVAYGANRADFSAIPGGIVPGVLILKPDFPENKEDWPFLWGENEYVVNLGASYIMLVQAGLEMLEEENAN